MKTDKKNKDFDEYKLPKRRQPVFQFFSKLLFRPIYGVRCESAIESLPDKAIIVSVHAAKNGPLAIAVSYPKFAVTWGHHAMLGTYKERFSYLRNVLYIQKMHKNKFVATLKALYEAVFSIFIYRGIKVIGTYTDMRLLTTVRNSMTVLDSGASVIIYPEDSSEGYFDELRSAYPGFAMLASIYYKKHGEDVPVIPAYVSLKKRRFIIGKPRYVHEMELSGMKQDDIAAVLKDDINSLYRDYIVADKKINTELPDAPVRTQAYYNEEK
jgi:hypothetical protein